MDRKIETYLRAVRRRLNMPKELKNRVMMDFSSSIEARIEDGQNSETILAELGTPRQAATELNQQMQEYTYRKSPWRWCCLAIAILSGLCIAYHGLSGLFLVLFNKVHNASIGIIGGADGPTSIFIATSGRMPATIAMYILLTVTGILGFLILRKLKK